MVGSAHSDGSDIFDMASATTTTGLLLVGYSLNFQISGQVIISAHGNTSIYNDYSSNYYDYTL